MKIIEPYTPELIKSAQDYIKLFIDKNGATNVLEFGSGWSTIWFAQLGCNVVSFEHDIDWYNEVMSVIDKLKLHHTCQVIFDNPKRFKKHITELPDKFHIAYVDCIDEYRIECARTSIPKLFPDSILVIDDSHWDMWKAFTRNVPKCKKVDIFKGQHKRKDDCFHYHETTIFRKSHD